MKCDPVTRSTRNESMIQSAAGSNPVRQPCALFGRQQLRPEVILGTYVGPVAGDQRLRDSVHKLSTMTVIGLGTRRACSTT